MNIDDTTVRWAIVTFGGGMITLLIATWKSGRLSRDAEKKLEMAEDHERQIYGDQKATPAIKGLKAEVHELGLLLDSRNIVVKGLARGHAITSISDEHRIEADVRAFHQSAAAPERQSSPAPETAQQRRERLNAEQQERFEERERAELRTNQYGTPLPPAPYEEVGDPFSEDRPPPAARGRLPTPYHTTHSHVPQQPGKKRRRDDESG